MKTNIKHYTKYLFAVLMVLSVSVTAWGTTIASWGKVSIAASTAITASGGDANNLGVAQFTSDKAMTTAGTYAYYGSGITGTYTNIVFSNLTLTGYRNIRISFYSRASEGKAWQLWWSTNGSTWYSCSCPNTTAMTTTETLYTMEGVPPTATYLKLVHLGSKSGNLYFGTVTISGDNASECTSGVAKGIAPGDEIIFYYTDGYEVGSVDETYHYCTRTSYTGTPAGAYVFTIEAGYTVNTYSFKHGGKYLRMTSGANNTLTMSETKDNASSWSVRASNTGQGTIVNQEYGEYSFKYYSSNTRFSSYKTGGNLPYMYRYCPAEFHVTYDGNGATSGSVPVDNYSYDPAGTDQATVLGNTGGLVKTGYSFGGWNTNPTGTGSNYTAGDQFYVTDNITLYAKWTPNPYTIMLNNQSADAGKGGTSSISVTYDASTNLTGTPAITVPQKTGYTFGGYYTGEGGIGTQIIAANGNVNASAGGGNTYTNASKQWKYADNITLYAKWTQTVDLLKNTGSSDGSVTVTYNVAGTASFSAAVKAGWTCTGYWTTSSGGYKVIEADGTLAEYSSNISSYINSDGKWIHTGATELYAQWVVNGYFVTFNKNATLATGEMDEQEFEYGTAQNLTSCAFSYTGHTFEGWSTTEDGDVEYVDGEEVNNLTDENAGIVELYAVWSTNSYTLTVGEPSNVTIKATPEDESDITEGKDADVEYDKFVTLNAVADDGYTFAGWKVTKDEDGSDATTDVMYDDDILMMPAYNITVTALMYKDYVFSCSELSLTGPSGDLVFITSKASKTVRSQEAFHVTGSGLTPGATVTFSFGNDDLNEVFNFKKADGTAPTVSNADDATKGTIDTDIYVFYTPSSGSTTDGIETATNLIASVAGTKPKTATLNTKTIIGRHLPTAGYVIAGKKDNKWYALPSNMASTSTPAPSEIAVNDINNPSIAYTDASNIYGLEGPTTSGGGNNIASGYGQYVRLTMSIESSSGSGKPAPLFGTSGSEDASNSPKVGKSGPAIATNNLSEGWWWELKQTNTSITNPQDAKYTIKCANNNHTLSIKNSPFVWGLYASGVEELRLIPASDVVFTEAYFVEWGQHGGVIEVDATGIDATSVVAHLNGASSSAITLVQTKASDAKNKNSKYNYTVNFGGSIDFAAAASNGAMLTLEWKNGATTKAVSNIVVPKIVASNITINKANYPLKSDWNTEVHVLPGKTVTVDPSAYDGSNVTIKELNIYPGATVVASTGTLIATNLVGSKTYDVARLHVTASTATLKATNVYADWYIDYDQYYPVAVPWNATVENFSYRYSTVSPTVGPSANIRLKYYDGESRATNVQEGVGIGANWKTYGDAGCTAVPATLEPSKGYAMTAKRPTGKAFSIIRMPLTLPTGTWADGSWTTNGEAGNISTTHKDQVYVKAYNTGSTPIYAQGWNLIANPYMSLYNGTITLTPDEGDATTIKVVNIPDVDFKEYGQYATTATKLKPSSGFLIQTPATGTITFGTANRIPSAPSYRTEEKPESTPEQQAYIMLNNENSEDMMGLFVSEKYTADYDLNGDVEKLLSDGTSLRTYMHYGNMNLAYVALTETLAREWIPVTVRVPQSGEYTFSLHEASIVGELEGVYLIDYAEDGRVTNLIEQDYTFVAEAGTIDGRFAINAIVGERSTPTDIDVVNGGGDLNSDKPFKFIYHDKMYIYHRGVIYDATGKRVREIK